MEIKKAIRKWLGIESLEYRIQTIEDLILHEYFYNNGFAVLKKHLNRPDRPLPRYMGEEIKQD